ncbi:MAG: hypothetical protein HC828_14195, partial [Blastochloris sp.]|nr:hypothetical protein [Blastochloris sp.]
RRAARICALSGLLATPDCPLTRVEWFIEDTAPTEYDNFYQRFTIDRDTGLLADESTPPDRRIERVLVVLPQEARDWGLRNGLLPPPVGAVAVMPDADVGLRLLEPDPAHDSSSCRPLIPDGTSAAAPDGRRAPATESVTYLLDGEPLGTATEAPWVVWWPLQLGDHELVAEAALADGTGQTSDPIPFTVVRDAPPQSYNADTR